MASSAISTDLTGRRAVVTNMPKSLASITLDDSQSITDITPTKGTIVFLTSSLNQSCLPYCKDFFALTDSIEEEVLCCYTKTAFV